MSRLKQLDRSEEDFFLLLALEWGRPDFSASRYLGPNHWESGIHGWLKGNPKGREFVQMVAQCGEAKARAEKLYKKYCVWTNQQDYNRDKANRSEVRGQLEQTNARSHEGQRDGAQADESG